MQIGQRFNPYRMFVGAVVPNCIMESTQISQTSKLCLARLHQHAGQNGECYPSIAKLAEEVGVKRSAAKRALQELVDIGLLEKVVKKKTDGVNETNDYYFLFHDIYEIAGMVGVGSKTTPPRSKNGPQGRVENGPQRESVGSESVLHSAEDSAQDVVPVATPTDPTPKKAKQTVPKELMNFVLEAFKIALGAADDTWGDAEWGRIYKPAKELLEYFKLDKLRAVQCIEEVGGALKASGLTWSPEAVCRWKIDWNMQTKNGGAYKGIGKAQ